MFFNKSLKKHNKIFHKSLPMFSSMKTNIQMLKETRGPVQE